MWLRVGVTSPNVGLPAPVGPHPIQAEYRQSQHGDAEGTLNK
jgi:hypothetical protein